MSSDADQPQEPLAEGTDPVGWDPAEDDNPYAAGLVEEPPPPPASLGTRLLGVLAGLVLAIVGAVGWAVLTTATGRRFALLAVVVGILIGVVVRRVGKFSGIKGGIVAGVLGLFGAALGQFLEGYALQANAYNDAQIVDAAHRNWSIFKQWEEWGFSKGWDVFVDNLGILSWLTLVLAAAAAFIYASDSGRTRRPAQEEEEPDGEAGDEDPIDEVPEPPDPLRNDPE